MNSTVIEMFLQYPILMIMRLPMLANKLIISKEREMYELLLCSFFFFLLYFNFFFISLIFICIFWQNQRKCGAKNLIKSALVPKLRQSCAELGRGRTPVFFLISGVARRLPGAACPGGQQCVGGGGTMGEFLDPCP